MRSPPAAARWQWSDGPDRIDFEGSIHLAIASEDGGESRRSRIYGGIKSGKGRKIRSIICAAFVEYFRGNSRKLEWEENARVYE